MTQQTTGGATAPPDVIYVIRHGEKAADPPPAVPGQSPPAPVAPFGVDDHGNQDAHSLLPRGWQRSGALAALFDPALGTLQAGLQTPAALLSPFYGDPAKTAAHRTYQTIQGLSDRVGLPIVSTFAEGRRQRPERRLRRRADLLGARPHPGACLVAAGHPGNGQIGRASCR